MRRPRLTSEWAENLQITSLHEDRSEALGSTAEAAVLPEEQHSKSAVPFLPVGATAKKRGGLRIEELVRERHRGNWHEAIGCGNE